MVTPSGITYDRRDIEEHLQVGLVWAEECLVAWDQDSICKLCLFGFLVFSNSYVYFCLLCFLLSCCSLPSYLSLLSLLYFFLVNKKKRQKLKYLMLLTYFSHSLFTCASLVTCMQYTLFPPIFLLITCYSDIRY